MDKSQIEEELVRFEAWFSVTHGFYEFYKKNGIYYRSQEVQIAFNAWLAAKQDAETRVEPASQPRIGDVKIGCAPTKEFLDIAPQAGDAVT